MTKFIMFFNLLIVSAYNIDTNYPILYPDSMIDVNHYSNTKFQHSYFGYSVLLHRDLQKNTSWLFIGAPRGNISGLKFLNEPGVVYRCSMPGSCMELRPIAVGNEKIYIRQIDMNAYVIKRQSWFGGVMSIEKNSGFLTVCAPRTILHIMTHRYIAHTTLHGLCYSGLMSSTSILEPEMTEITSFDFSKDTWFNPIHGFSVTFAVSKKSRSISRIVGRPNDNIIGSVNVAYFSKRTFNELFRRTVQIPTQDSLSQLGYAVTSGYYFNPNQPLYVCADPKWNYVGQIVVIDLDEHLISLANNPHGSEIGEFFGASLASGDLNNDGLHDLVVGAPHWGNDNGRIYIYLGSSKKEFEPVTILEGIIEDAQFGYAVAIGDVDRDGFGDVIVGAPWEKSGAIYIYNGNASLKDKVKPTMSQKITTEFFNSNFQTRGANIQTFGFSISEPTDIDNNGYADIAVGAYKSGHVIVLQSKPVIRTNLTVYTVPNTLNRNISSFLIEACVKYYGYNVANTHTFKVSFVIDEKYKRTEKTSLNVYSMDARMCVNATVILSDDIQNFIEPITIYASHDFICNDSSDFRKTCPVESRNSRLKSVQVFLPFDIECGDDGICNSNIYAVVEFKGIRENNTWVIGSNDITLEIRLKNYAEPAYLTTVVFTLPKKIVLRSILPFCEENMNDILIVTCNVGNPFGMYEQKTVKLDLDMRHLTTSSFHEQVLEFSTEIQTHSTNHGMHVIKSQLNLESETSLMLKGKAIEEDYYLLDNDQSNINFQHIYQILKIGVTPIEEARLVINLPIAIDDSDSLILLNEPRMYISGKYYECYSNGVDLVDTQQNEFSGEIVSTALDLYNSDYNETLQNATHNRLKRKVNDHITSTTRILQMLYNTVIKFEDTSNDNLTFEERNIVYMNCSTYGVSCSMVNCDLSALKMQQDVGKLVLKLILNTTKFKDTFQSSNEMKIVRFSTDAYVQIIKPKNKMFETDIRNNTSITTEFYNAVKPQKLQLWVVFVSISLGLILLCIIIILLSMIGFFKRITKEELFALKSDEIIDDTEKYPSE